MPHKNRPPFLVATAAGALLALLLATLPRATADETAAAKPATEGWHTIFNGKNLDGWDGDPRLWRVEDGILIGESDDDARKIDANSFLIWTGGEPGDFELEFEARLSGKNNSGLQYRSRRLDGDGWRVAGYQFDLHPNQPFFGMLYEEGGRGIVCKRGQRVKLADKPEVLETFDIEELDAGQWQSFRLVAKGRTLEHYVNGKLAAVIDDQHPDKAAAKGIIAIQLHKGPPMKIEFRNLRLREIVP